MVSLFLGSLAVALWFAFHAITDALYFNDPRNVDVALKPWMTPRYVVLTYDLPRPLVMELLELDPDDDRGIRLGRLAQERNISMDDLTTLVRDATAAYREGQE
ncbi:hypothetical protein SLH49_08220 [Cognatiyoonia sp. IB215446]|uniref:hypothetical protein n=1 Tax=Cognatiyoonia sp. IB215446 TaxID=3097355 RepID=UPI002A0E682F|nr:hypothetical protein [Cognatiyoonia sp. IB215446]MDX8347969.1 hypothetical protein [Cognatiyoonia sp. IB215446]